MADSYGPFDGQPWSEGQWYDFAAAWAPSGVLGTGASSPTSGDFAFASSGLSVSAGTGRAWVRGAGLERTGTPPSHIVGSNAHGSWSRRDRLVLVRDLGGGRVYTSVRIGTPAATPQAPSLEQVEAGVWEEPLFSFLVPPNNGTTITGVIDERTWVDPGGNGTSTLVKDKIRVTGTGDASETSTEHPFQVGNTAGLNIIIDNNEILARDGAGLADNLGFGGVRLILLGQPENFSDAATKGYVDALVADSGWVTVSTAGGRSIAETPQVRKIGKVVYARGGWTSSGMGANSSYDVGTIPVGYRPSSTMVTDPGLTAAGSTGRMIITPGGTVTVETGGDIAGYFQMDLFTWLVD